MQKTEAAGRRVSHKPAITGKNQRKRKEENNVSNGSI